MEKIAYFFADILSRILTSKLFWVALALFLIWRLSVAIYRHLKLGALEQLEYDRAFSADGVFAGDSFNLTETIHNPTLFPLLAVNIEFFVPNGFTVDDVVCKEYTRVTSIFHIPPHATVTKTHTVRADLRGHYHLETAAINYRKHEFLFPTSLAIRVYPNYSTVRADIIPDLYRTGDSISQNKYIEDPFFISAIRPYQSGDPMRSINFKASVRSFSGGIRQLMANSYDSSRNFDSMIFLDLFNYADAGEYEKVRFETGLCYSCYLLSETLQNGGSVGFASNCAAGLDPYVYIPCSTGNIHTKNILNCLSEISYYNKREYSISSLLERFASNSGRSVDIYLITPTIDLKTAETLHRLESMGRNVCVIPLCDAGGTI